MKKILLTAIIAMLGMSAWAAKPEAGTKGYLYNAAAGKFIGADAKLSDTGQEFEIYFKSADSKNPNEEFPDRGFGENSFFVRFKTGSNYLAISSQPVAISANYSQMVVKETENGWLISHAYVLNDGNAPDWVKNNTDEYQGAYLQVVDGELVFSKDETNKAAYWQFIDEDTYKKIAGPTYPIAMTGAVSGVTVDATEGTTEAPYAATFTTSAGIQNIFQIKNFDVSEFRKYGYKKIVVEFTGATAGKYHAFAYGTGLDPNWDIVTGMDNAPEWLAMGDSKYEVALVEDVINDFTIFSWIEIANVPLTITACYFSKEELGAESEPEPEPTPAVFPEFGVQGFVYNPASGLVLNASATLVAKASINKESDIVTVWQKGTETYDASRVRIAAGKDGDTWKSLRVVEGEEGAYTIEFKNDGYSRLTLEAAEGGYYIKSTYTTDNESNHPGYIKANVEDGNLTIAESKDEYCVWQFLTEEEFDALATSISSVAKTAAPVKGIFNVAGQQLKNLQKGLNIVNGKKIMVK